MARARSRAFWIVAGLTVLAAGLRFATLGVQAYHHDEIVTASRVLRGGFGARDGSGRLQRVGAAALLRAGLGLDPADRDRRVRPALALGRSPGWRRCRSPTCSAPSCAAAAPGSLAAALVAVNPMLLWYSQEARGYALLVLLDRGRRALLRPRPRARPPARLRPAGGSPRRWRSRPTTSRSSRSRSRPLWLLWRRGRARGRPGSGSSASPAWRWRRWRSTRCSLGHAEWIGGRSLGHRLWETGVTFLVGETGDIIARPETAAAGRWCRCSPLLAGAGAARAARRRGRAPRRRAPCWPSPRPPSRSRWRWRSLAPGKDYVLARNLLPALVPLLVAVAIGVTAARRAARRRRPSRPCSSPTRSASASGRASRRRCSGPTGTRSPRGSASPRRRGRWSPGRWAQASLRHYLSTGSFQVLPSERLPLVRARDRLRLRRPGAAGARASCSARASARSATSGSAASTCGATRCRAPTSPTCALRAGARRGPQLPQQRRPDRRGWARAE